MHADEFIEQLVSRPIVAGIDILARVIQRRIKSILRGSVTTGSGAHAISASDVLQKRLYESVLEVCTARVAAGARASTGECDNVVTSPRGSRQHAMAPWVHDISRIARPKRCLCGACA